MPVSAYSVLWDYELSRAWMTSVTPEDEEGRVEHAAKLSFLCSNLTVETKICIGSRLLLPKFSLPHAITCPVTRCPSMRVYYGVAICRFDSPCVAWIVTWKCSDSCTSSTDCRRDPHTLCQTNRVHVL